MHQELYCIIKANVQIMIVVIVSIYDELKMKFWYFCQSCSDVIILNDNVPSSALDKVVTLAGEVLFERKLPTLNQAGGDSLRQN